MDIIFKCDHCGTEFDTPKLIPHTFYEPDEYVCPICKSSSISEGHVCTGCDEWVSEYEFATDDLCMACVGDAVEAMKSYMKDGKDMTEHQKKAFLDYWSCL